MHIENHELADPKIPSADINGLIKTVDLNSDIAIYLPLWSDAMQNDAYQLMLNSIPVGSRKILSGSISDTDIELTLAIPIEHLNEDGFYSVGYQIVAFPGGGTRVSGVKQIRIDRIQPGGPLLSPIIFPTASFDTLKGKIPTYIGMEPGDIIQTVCDSTLGPTHEILPANMTTHAVEILFTRPFLESLSSEKISITYHVTDRAGNRSILAPAIEVTIQN